MNTTPTKAYVFQPYAPSEDGKFFGVSGPDSFGFDKGTLKGLTRKDAEEIVRFCNENAEFAKGFITELRRRLELDSKSFECGCQFESVLSNAVLLCYECDHQINGGCS